ncbi:MAG: DASS family sodium-coupled anion symporter [Spirochaetales bacterium]
MTGKAPGSRNGTFGNKLVKSPEIAKKWIYVGMALLAFILVLTLAPPDSLVQTITKSINSATGKPAYPQMMHSGRPAMATLAVLVFCLILWVTEAIPFHITGFLSLALLTLLRVGPYADIIRTGFGNEIVVFFLGVLALTAFIIRSGLGRRISAFILSITGNDTRLIILGFLIAGMLLSWWITEMAVAAMLMPLARAILEEEGCKPRESNFGRALMIAVAWGPMIGGIGTPAGTGANPVAMQFLSTMAGIQLTFTDWMWFGVPSSILMFLPAWRILLFFFPPEMTHLKISKEELKRQFSRMPPMNREEKITILVFLLTVVIWIFSPLLEQIIKMPIPISLPILITLCLFFFPGSSEIKWREIEKEINWAGILLIVSGLSLGTYLYRTGTAEWLAITFLGGIGKMGIFLQLFLVTLGVCLLKVLFSSNTVTATILIPLIIGLGKATGTNVTAITLAAGLTTSLAFILVTSTPTAVIPFNAGYFSIKDMAKAGVVITVFASLTIAAVFLVVGNLRGML